MVSATTRMFLKSIDSMDIFQKKSLQIKRMINSHIKQSGYIKDKIVSDFADNWVLVIDFSYTDLTVRTSERMVYEGGDYFWEILFYSQPETEKIKVLTIYLSSSGQFFTEYDRQLTDIDEELDPDFFIEQLLTSAIGKGIISL